MLTKHVTKITIIKQGVSEGSCQFNVSAIDEILVHMHQLTGMQGEVEYVCQ